MKAINYRTSKAGNKIVRGIVDAAIDPRETRDAAIAAVQATQEYNTLVVRIETYNAYIDQLVNEGYSPGKPDTLPVEILQELQNKISLVAQQQALLRQMQDDYAAANPIFLKPRDAVLAADAEADLVSADMVEGKYVKVNTDANDDFVSHVQADSKQGTVYRLPNTMNWITADEPDSDIPAEAVFNEPDQAEIDTMETTRIAGLTAGEKATEKAAYVIEAENQYVHSATMADTLGTQGEIDAAKAAALTAYNNRLTELDGIYGP